MAKKSFVILSIIILTMSIVVSFFAFEKTNKTVVQADVGIVNSGDWIKHIDYDSNTVVINSSLMTPTTNNVNSFLLTLDLSDGLNYYVTDGIFHGTLFEIIVYPTAGLLWFFVVDQLGDAIHGAGVSPNGNAFVAIEYYTSYTNSKHYFAFYSFSNGYLADKYVYESKAFADLDSIRITTSTALSPELYQTDYIGIVSLDYFLKQLKVKYGDLFTEEIVKDNYIKGYNEGSSATLGTSTASSLFNSVSSFLAVQIYPHVTLGTIIGLPLVLSLAFFVFKMVRG